MKNRVVRMLAVSVLLAVAPGDTASQTEPPSPRSSVGPNGPVTIHNGFLTARDFRGLPQARKVAYVAGVLDGMLLAPFFGAPKERLAWLEGCVVGMNDEQVTAILSRFVTDNPARWHEHVHTQFYVAMRDACGKE